MAGLTRLELATFCVTGRHSNQTELQSHDCHIVGIFIQSGQSVNLTTRVLVLAGQTELQSHDCHIAGIFIQSG